MIDIHMCDWVHMTINRHT